jgi:NDP-sugar pyrophosphorylase family protein
MAEALAAVVLGAGAGTRLRPLTLLRPQALCPVDNTPLIDLAIGRARTATPHVAVNVHHGRHAMESHLAGTVHLSIEAGAAALGTAGALGLLRPWIDGRGTIVLNSDTWCPGDLDHLVDGWDGERVRILAIADDVLGPRTGIAGALMPWRDVEHLAAEPSGLYEASWREALGAGRVEVVRHDGPCIDCGTAEQYLAANMAASGGASVIGRGAVVEGTVERSVVWSGAVVRADEHLSDAIRAGSRVTVLVRPS